MAAAKGNQYAAKAKQWQMAIERALERRGNGSRVAALDALAEIFISKCDEGDLSAFKELADRLDGKPHQTSEMVVERREVKELSDDELHSIASGSGTAEASKGEGKSSKLH